MAYEKKISQQLNIAVAKAKATIDLLDNGNTLAFIARYRKEVTGNLDEEKISQIIENLNKLRNLDVRKKTVLTTIKESPLVDLILNAFNVLKQFLCLFFILPKG